MVPFFLVNIFRGSDIWQLCTQAAAAQSPDAGAEDADDEEAAEEEPDPMEDEQGAGSEVDEDLDDAEGPEPSQEAAAVEDGPVEDDESDHLSSNTLRLGGPYPDKGKVIVKQKAEPAESDSDDSMHRCSQLRGRWMGKAYEVFHKLEKAQQTVVPIEDLYLMLTKGDVLDQWAGTFSMRDLESLADT